MQQPIKSLTSSRTIFLLSKFITLCIAFGFFLSTFSCKAPEKSSLINKEDREVVNKFLRYALISEQGIYTILGSKPVTYFDIPSVISEDELREEYNQLPENFRKKVSFKKYNNIQDLKEIRETCNNWKMIQHKYIGDHFVIYFDEQMNSGYLANIPLVVYVLRYHYEDFSKVLGADFDPVLVARELSDSSSRFWKIFNDNSNSYLMGLLFGYGEKNSKFFQWEKEQIISFPFRIASYHSPHLKKVQLSRNTMGDIENLALPPFVIYQPVDETVGKYLFERKQILQIYRKRDFAETTVAFLKGKAVHQLSKKRIITLGEPSS